MWFTAAAFGKRRLNSGAKRALCFQRNPVFYFVVHGVKLPKAVGLCETYIGVPAS